MQNKCVKSIKISSLQDSRSAPSLRGFALHSVIARLANASRGNPHSPSLRENPLGFSWQSIKKDYKMKQGFVYILFSKPNGTLYTGATSDLAKRIFEHKSKLAKGFTQKYNIDKLGYYEVCENIESAIMREKQLKSGKRQTKIDLIKSQNPQWEDLYETLF
ncbi:GIY-YIG nuclease family protein [Helicobacter sp. 23-1044]